MGRRRTRSARASRRDSLTGLLHLALALAAAVAPCQAHATPPEPSQRAIDPAVPTAVPAHVRSPPPPPPPPARDPRSQYIERRLAQTRASREPAPPPDGPPRGIGMMISGGALIGPGTVAFTGLGLLARSFSGGGFCAHCPDDTSSDSGDGGLTGAGPFALAGISFAAGVTLLVLGIRQHGIWRDWKNRQARAPGGRRLALDSAGLSLRF